MRTFPTTFPNNAMWESSSFAANFILQGIKPGGLDRSEHGYMRNYHSNNAL